MVAFDALQEKLKEIESITDISKYLCGFLDAYSIPRATLVRLGITEGITPEKGIAIGSKMLVVYTLSTNLYARFDYVQRNIVKAKSYRFITLVNTQEVLSLDTQTNEWLAVIRNDIHSEFEFFLPLLGIEKVTISEKQNVNVKIGEKFAQFYNEALMLNPGQNDNLGTLIINLVGAFFADSCGLFEIGSIKRWINLYSLKDGSDLNELLKTIFGMLSSSEDNWPAHFSARVNGSLVGLPQYTGNLRFNSSTRDLLNAISDFNWDNVEPEVLGSLIQSIIDPAVSAVAYNYTSTANVYKVVGPLFIDDLYEAFDNQKAAGILTPDFLNRLSTLRVFDPSCGTGNFLMVCLRELKKLEHQVKDTLKAKGISCPDYEYVSIEQFYGIESNRIATSITQIGLAFTDRKYGNSNHGSIVILPCKNIINGSALEMDWDDFCHKDNAIVFMVGNPSYKGGHSTTAAQQHEMHIAFSPEIENGFKIGELDYASAYFYKAARYIQGTNGGFAFVTLTQGIHVPTLWPVLFSRGIVISFAHTSFKWKNEGRNTTAVTVVIIGCRAINNPHVKIIYDKNLSYIAEDISPYLTKGGVIVQKENRGPICTWMPKMIKGNMPYGTDYLLMGPDDKELLVETFPDSRRFLKRVVGSEEFVQSKERWCLWIYDEDLADALRIPPIAERIEQVRISRMNSKDKAAQKLASRAHQFREMNMPQRYSLVIPSVTSENRPYLQIGYLGKRFVITNLAFVIYDAQPWVFGIISSKMHNLWIRTVCGGLETRIRYSNVLGYNTFPIPELSDDQKAMISEAALGVIIEREQNSEMSLVELYNEATMPVGLRYAHGLLDDIVERCYNPEGFHTDQERLDAMFVLYKELKGV